MSAPAIVWLTVGLVSLAAVIAVLVGLVRHLLLLGRTLRRFSSETRPLVEEIAAEAARASDRAGKLPRGARFGRS